MLDLYDAGISYLIANPRDIERSYRRGLKPTPGSCLFDYLNITRRFEFDNSLCPILVKNMIFFGINPDFPYSDLWKLVQETDIPISGNKVEVQHLESLARIQRTADVSIGGRWSPCSF